LAGFRQHLLRYRFLCWEKEHKKPTNKQTETQRVHRNTADRLIGTLHPLGANGQGPLPSVDPSRAGGQYDGGVAAGNNASVRRSSHITPPPQNNLAGAGADEGRTGPRRPAWSQSSGGMDHAQILTHCLDMSAASMRIATSNQYYNRVPFQEINQSILELQRATAALEEYRRHSLDLNDSGQMSLYQLRV
jgi:hypothetical protein